MKIETKYNIGDTVWYLTLRRGVEPFVVSHIKVVVHSKDSMSVSYAIPCGAERAVDGGLNITRIRDTVYIPEEELFSSKEELLNNL